MGAVVDDDVDSNVDTHLIYDDVDENVRRTRADRICVYAREKTFETKLSLAKS